MNRLWLASPKEPPKIHHLNESVVNRVAAGEVIQRPILAVKESVENSLDAGSTSINIIVKDGALNLIQVSDDGLGICYEDLPVLCEMHKMSKLSKYEDLQSMKSMGFRREALASMTYVGHVSTSQRHHHLNQLYQEEKICSCSIFIALFFIAKDPLIPPQASKDAKKLVDGERAFARAEIETTTTAVQRVEEGSSGTRASVSCLREAGTATPWFQY